jgi:hypothetical protein
MKVRSVGEIETDFKEVLENEDVYALSQWYARGPDSLGKSEQFDEKKYLQRAIRNAKDVGRILDAIHEI